MKRNDLSKLFGALVLGGSMVANAQDMLKPVEAPEVHCQMKLVVEKSTDQGLLPKKTTCLDLKSDEEIMQLVDEAREPVEVEPPVCTIWGL